MCLLINVFIYTGKMYVRVCIRVIAFTGVIMINLIEINPRKPSSFYLDISFIHFVAHCLINKIINEI